MFRLRLQIPIKLRITITWTACRRDFRSPGRRRFTRICLSTGSNHRLTRSVSRIDLRARESYIRCSFSAWRSFILFLLLFSFFSSVLLIDQEFWPIGYIPCWQRWDANLRHVCGSKVVLFDSTFLLRFVWKCEKFNDEGKSDWSKVILIFRT